MIVALAAVEESWNSVTPAPLPVKKELMLMILELAADELLKNLVVPPKSLMKRVKFPAVAPLVNTTGSRRIANVASKVLCEP